MLGTNQNSAAIKFICSPCWKADFCSCSYSFSLQCHCHLISAWVPLCPSRNWPPQPSPQPACSRLFPGCSCCWWNTEIFVNVKMWTEQKRGLTSWYNRNPSTCVTLGAVPAQMRTIKCSCLRTEMSHGTRINHLLLVPDTPLCVRARRSCLCHRRSLGTLHYLPFEEVLPKADAFLLLSPRCVQWDICLWLTSWPCLSHFSPALPSWSPLSKESSSIVILLSINTECVFLTGTFPTDTEYPELQGTCRTNPVQFWHCKDPTCSVLVEQGLGEETTWSLEGRNDQPQNTD